MAAKHCSACRCLIRWASEFCFDCVGKQPAASTEAIRASASRRSKVDRDEVRRLRGEGLSQEEIAHRVGCSQSTVSLILRGHA